MVKKFVFASIALLSLHAIQAGDAHNNMQHSSTHAEKTSPGDLSAHPCPCCGGTNGGGIRGWVLIPAGPGTPCQGMQDMKKAQEHDPHHQEPDKGALHPPRMTAQEQLESDLKHVTPHMYLRANPHNPNHKEGEWGKERDGKVYFKHLGSWVHDPNVKVTDRMDTGVKDKTQVMEDALKRQHQPVGKEPPIPAPQRLEPSTTKAWPKVNVPDALGTASRPNTVHTAEGNERELAQGSPNKAQTGLTGQASPKIDASSSLPIS